MHVVFVSLGAGELLGVESLSAVLQRAGHRTSLVHDPALFDDRFDLQVPALARRFDQRAEILRRIRALRPDLVAFSCISSTFGWARAIARELRPIPTVFGGVHPSAVPAFVAALPEVDFVCEGEGEEALLALVESGDGRGIPGIWAHGEPPPGPARHVADLDALPFPDKELYAPTLPRGAVYNIMASRGCPYRCTYCFNSFFGAIDDPKAWVRRRSVDHVLEELRRAKRRDRMSHIDFQDDILTADRGWIDRFLPRLREEIGVPYVCSVHARYLDAPLVRLLKDTGCIRVKMGIQSLAPTQWKARHLKRAEREEELARAIDACRAVGLRMEVDHILGFPGEPPESNAHAFAFYQAHTPARIATFWLAYFPGTEITAEAHRRGELSDAELRAIEAGDVPSYHKIAARTPAARAALAEHEGYATAFQLLPLVPAPLRRHLRPAALGRVPGAAAGARWVQAAGMLARVSRGEGHEVLSYLRWYTHQLAEAASRRPSAE